MFTLSLYLLLMHRCIFICRSLFVLSLKSCKIFLLGTYNTTRGADWPDNEDNDRVVRVRALTKCVSVSHPCHQNHKQYIYIYTHTNTQTHTHTHTQRQTDRQTRTRTRTHIHTHIHILWMYLRDNLVRSLSQSTIYNLTHASFLCYISSKCVRFALSRPALIGGETLNRHGVKILFYLGELRGLSRVDCRPYRVVY